MTFKQKQEFRMSNTWKHFRRKMRKKHFGMDKITMKPLLRTWNLHHIDLRSENYCNITNENMFVPLNEDTHKFIHWLYPFYKKDKEIIERIRTLLFSMEYYTSNEL